ncbi:MAG TPA: TetR/AcrR family transcriptional regulator [Alphaproteobacteria bacterium]|nr:TetR/AcrR family transcriptional regulator [Alphaproteobacteria bacterium]
MQHPRIAGRRRRLPSRRSSAKKQQILEAAARVFRQKGYDRATLRDIANEAGLLPGSLYYHIRSKEDLLRQVVEQPIRELYGQLEDLVVAEAPAADKLAHALAMHLHAFDTHYPSLFVYLQNLLQVDAMRRPLHKQAKRYEECWQQLLIQGIQRGEFPPDLDVKIAVFAILGMCNWMHRWYRQDGRLSIEEIIQQYTRLVLDGVRCQGRD